jgi:hypothetical protein
MSSPIRSHDSRLINTRHIYVHIMNLPGETGTTCSQTWLHSLRAYDETLPFLRPCTNPIARSNETSCIYHDLMRMYRMSFLLAPTLTLPGAGSK